MIGLDISVALVRSPPIQVSLEKSGFPKLSIAIHIYIYHYISIYHLLSLMVFLLHIYIVEWVFFLIPCHPLKVVEKCDWKIETLKRWILF